MVLRIAFSTVNLMRMKVEQAEEMGVQLTLWMMMIQAALLAKMLLDHFPQNG